jgi:hypothetical protein
MGLMACGDTEDHYLEPGYGHNFNGEAEVIRLPQIRTDDDQARPSLTENSHVDSTLLRALTETAEEHVIHDVFNLDEPIDEESLTESLSGNSLGLTPPLSPPSNRLIEDMSPEEVSRTCASMETELGNIDEEDIVTGTCTFEYMARSNRALAPVPETCDLRMSKCIDQSAGPINPIAFCQTPTKVPSNCEVSYPEINACLRTLKESQQALNELDICDASVFTSEEADTSYDAFRTAQTCLLKLNTYCPVLLTE